MDNNIVQTVYDTLNKHTEDISKVIAERDKLEGEIKANRYTPQVLRDEIYPKRDNLRTKASIMCDNALRDAKKHIEQYRQDAAELNNLNPDELTDDVRLLQSGITLLPRDIEAILKRNEGNRTMSQIALRYAKEHNIKVNRYYRGGEAEEETARNLDGLLMYYKNWIDKPNAKEMLNKFFNVTE